MRKHLVELGLEETEEFVSFSEDGDFITIVVEELHGNKFINADTLYEKCDLGLLPSEFLELANEAPSDNDEAMVKIVRGLIEEDYSIYFEQYCNQEILDLTLEEFTRELSYLFRTIWKDTPDALNSMLVGLGVNGVTVDDSFEEDEDIEDQVFLGEVIKQLSTMGANNDVIDYVSNLTIIGFESMKECEQEQMEMASENIALSEALRDSHEGAIKEFVNWQIATNGKSDIADTQIKQFLGQQE